MVAMSEVLSDEHYADIGRAVVFAAEAEESVLRALKYLDHRYGTQFAASLLTKPGWERKVRALKKATRAPDVPPTIKFLAAEACWALKACHKTRPLLAHAGAAFAAALDVEGMIMAHPDGKYMSVSELPALVEVARFARDAAAELRMLSAFPDQPRPTALRPRPDASSKIFTL